MGSEDLISDDEKQKVDLKSLLSAPALNIGEGVLLTPDLIGLFLPRWRIP